MLASEVAENIAGRPTLLTTFQGRKISLFRIPLSDMSFLHRHSEAVETPHRRSASSHPKNSHWHPRPRPSFLRPFNSITNAFLAEIFRRGSDRSHEAKSLSSSPPRPVGALGRERCHLLPASVHASPHPPLLLPSPLRNDLSFPALPSPHICQLKPRTRASAPNDRGRWRSRSAGRRAAIQIPRGDGKPQRFRQIRP